MTPASTERASRPRRSQSLCRYLRLGGGCRGCAVATVTLSQGIEALPRALWCALWRAAVSNAETRSGSGLRRVPPRGFEPRFPP